MVMLSLIRFQKYGQAVQANADTVDLSLDMLVQKSSTQEETEVMEKGNSPKEGSGVNCNI